MIIELNLLVDLEINVLVDWHEFKNVVLKFDDV